MEWPQDSSVHNLWALASALSFINDVVLDKSFILSKPASTSVIGDDNTPSQGGQEDWMGWWIQKDYDCK